MRLLEASIALVGLAASCSGAWAQCKPSPPQVNVLAPAFRTTIEEVRDVAAFTPFPFLTEQSIAPGWKLNGVALVRPQVRTNIVGMKHPSCYEPRTVEIVLSFEDPVRIYIDSRFDRNSCNYAVVKAHELQHVDVYQRARTAYVPYFRAVVQNAVNAVVGQASQSRDGEDIVKQAISEAVDVAFSHMTGEAARVNAAIDSRENYLRTQALCPNW